MSAFGTTPSRLFIIIAAILVVGFLICGCSKKKTGPSLSAYEKQVAAFFTGVELIHQTTGMSDSLKARRYGELQKITGISGKEALSFIKKNHNNPQRWQTIEAQSIRFLELRRDTLKKEF